MDKKKNDFIYKSTKKLNEFYTKIFMNVKLIEVDFNFRFIFFMSSRDIVKYFK